MTPQDVYQMFKERVHAYTNPHNKHRKITGGETVVSQSTVCGAVLCQMLEVMND